MTMDAVFKAAGFALVGAVLSLTVKKNSQSTGILLAAAVSLGLLTAAVSSMAPVMAFASDLRDLTGLSDTVTAPLIKTAAIGMVTHIAESVCQDAGETAAAKSVELCGSILALCAVIPLMSAVTELIRDLL